MFFFFNDTATTEIYTLSLHDALPISTATATWTRRKTRPGGGSTGWPSSPWSPARSARRASRSPWSTTRSSCRSEEHTSELQSPCNLVCRLLLEKKKKYRSLFIEVAHL